MTPRPDETSHVISPVAEHGDGGPGPAGAPRPEELVAGATPQATGAVHHFADAARAQLADTQLRANLGRATRTIRAKRATAIGELADVEALREEARRIKAGALDRLDDLLAQFGAAVEAAGGQVHLAADAATANAIVVEIVRRHGASGVVKMKSLTTDEIGLNAALAAAGIHALETDLAELIVQLAGDRSSHILVPAIHRNRAQIRDLFARTIAPGRDLSDDPRELAEAARVYLRERFLRATVGVSGANFGVAETGSVCIVESEGNGRMCTTLPPVLVSVVGIEKLVPSLDDLEVFLQLLPRSATGERMNPYTSVWTGVTDGDGPRELHVILLDNGRRNALRDDVGRQALQCIRCGACLNVCPVYTRVGGHAYGSIYPGPIGAILTPQLWGMERYASLPFASTLCGACAEVCPVKIDIPTVLLHLRARAVREQAPAPERAAFRAAAWAFGGRRRFTLGQRFARVAQRPFMRGGLIRRLPGALGGWTRGRDLRPVAGETFREWWSRERSTREASSRAAPQPPRQPASGVAGEPPELPDRPRPDEPAAARPPELPALDLLCSRLADYKADVRLVVVGDPAGGSVGDAVDDPAGDVAAAVERVCAERGVRRLGVPPGLPAQWRPAGVEVVEDHQLAPAELDLLDGVVTGCTLAVAETGSLVLTAAPADGRRALTLVPDLHVCVVDEAQIVRDLHAAMPQIAAVVRGARRPVTFVSGPSATSDIELHRVEGVHGPRQLVVLVTLAPTR